MSSQSLARKYRPQDFDQVVGQPTTIQILKNALSQKKFHPAYLFAGPRGIGKTSLARIFAKALECEKGPTPKPCNQCSACQEITEGRSLSVLEIDGASNTSVDDVRDLREKVQYLPAGGRYKIYIIDEVHMLSTAAFNALLKTLEEPPPHAIFLLATTDPQKIPATVLSRVLRFDLRPITRTVVVDRLKEIAKVESVTSSDEALYLIAREAQGSLRDAVSLLDQIVSFSGPTITSQAVEQVIGIGTDRFILKIIDSILDKNAAQLLQASESAIQAGVDPKRLANDLLESFRHLLVAQVSTNPVLFDLPADTIQELATRAKKIPSVDLDRIFRILQRGLVDLLRSPQPKVLLDVLLLRLCQFDQLRSLDEILKGLTSSPPPPKSVAYAKPEPPLSDKISHVASLTPKPPPQLSKTWPEFLDFLRKKKPQLSSIMEQGSCLSLGEKEAQLSFPPRSIHRSLLEEPERNQTLRDLLAEFFGRDLSIRCQESQSSRANPSSQSLVNDAIAIFGPQAVTSPRKEAP